MTVPDRVLLFHRDFRGFSGGHLKVRHYFGHAEHSTRFRPRIFFTPGSVLGPANPWHGIVPRPLESWRPEEAAALFLAGLDWRAVPDPAPVPVINLVQGFGHADPDDPRHAFLRRPAVRICVSAEVAEALAATGIVNGPIHVIANAIDRDELPAGTALRDIPILIAGHKNPPFAHAVRDGLRRRGIESECLVDHLPRQAFLDRLARSAVALTIPLEREGFFLPGLEAMALGALVVCPDCGGNRGYCRDGETGFRPAYSVDEVVAATVTAATLDPAAKKTLLAAAAHELAQHGIAAERAAFLRILDAI
jgi:hypothetical protein